MRTIEKQETTFTDGDRISGELTIRFEDLPIDAFLKYRGQIRGIAGFGKIGISHTVINERALVEGQKHDAPIPADMPVAATIPAQVQKERRHMDHSWPRGKAAKFLDALIVPEDQVVPAYRKAFRLSKFTDAEILAFWKKKRGASLK